MFTNERISGIDGVKYMYSLQEYQERERQGLNDNFLGGASVSAMTAAYMAEYMQGGARRQDNGVHEKESMGRALVFGTPPVVDLEAYRQSKRKRKTPPQNQPAFAKTGEILTFEKATLAGKGMHPETGELLVQQNSAKRTVGYDLQFALPKSFSIMWGLGASAARKGSVTGLLWKNTIEEGQRRGVERVLRYCHENGLIIARRSEKRNGHESVGHIMFGQYDHKTSREGDPQVHTHNILFNICIRADGTTGTLDNAMLKKHGGAIAALYRMESVHYITNTLGIRASKVERNCEIDGVNEDVITTYSKRRGQVVDGVRDFGLEDTAHHREAAKHANRGTRKGKDEQPPLLELYDRWDQEAAAIGWRFETLVEAIQEAAEKKNRMEAEAWVAKRVEASLSTGEILPEERPQFDMDEIKARAYASLVSTNSVFEERRILKEVFEELQVYTDVDTAVKAVEALVASGELVSLAPRGDDMFFTTAEIIETEKTMLVDALSMTDNLPALDQETVQRFIEAGRILENGDRAELKPEQKKAAAAACGRDQITVIQGRAGAGKSFMLATVADIHRALGRDVYAIAPSHKAKEVVANDAQIAQEMAKAVAGFLRGVESGKINVHANMTIILDEGGTLGLDDMQKLVQIAKEKGARLIISGDTRQLQPVAKGAPMALLSRDEVCGCVVLGEIVRQKDLRQREASVLMSEGKVKEGLQTYLDTDRIKFSDSAMDDTQAAFLKDMDENPSNSRMIGVYRNKDAMKLNLGIRDELKERGVIQPSGWTNTTWTRGRNQRKVDREFCNGERIIFGEGFKLDEVEISNNTTATILNIDMATVEKFGEPTFEMKTDDGRIFKARPSQMIGYRAEEAKDKTTPKIDYAYAQTVYSLQGSTFDRMFVYAGEAGYAELVYVMLTRHKLDCNVFVDRERIHDALAAMAGKMMKLNTATGGAAENHTSAETEITHQQIVDQFLAECQKSGAKLNACDFHESVSAFLGDRIAKRSEREEQMKVEEEKKTVETAQPPAFLTKPRVPSFAAPRPAGAIVPKPEENRRAGNAEIEAQISKAEGDHGVSGIAADVREAAAKTKPSNGRQPYVSKRVTEEDRDRMARFDLYDFFVGYRSFDEVEAYKPKNGVEGYILRHDDIGKISIKKNYNGVWNWALREGVGKIFAGDKANPDESGLIWDYQRWRKGGTTIEAMHAVRSELGMTPTANANARPSTPYKDEVRERGITPPEPKKTLADRIKDGAYASWSYDAFKSVVGYVERAMKRTRENDGVNDHLLSRGIDRDTQRMFLGQIGTEHELSRKNPFGAIFPHVDLEGRAWNYERKGPKANESDKRSFTAMGAGTKRLGLLKAVDPSESNQKRDYKTATRYYVAESEIDALSLYQADGRPKGAMLISTFGNPNNEGLYDLYQLAKTNPTTEFHLAMDNDKAGATFTHLMQEVVTLARGTAENVVDRRPAPEYKDWNDQIQGKVWSNGEKEVEGVRAAKHADELAAGEAERAARRALEDAERKRRQAESGYQPSGPRR